MTVGDGASCRLSSPNSTTRRAFHPALDHLVLGGVPGWSFSRTPVWRGQKVERLEGVVKDVWRETLRGDRPREALKVHVPLPLLCLGPVGGTARARRRAVDPLQLPHEGVFFVLRGRPSSPLVGSRRPAAGG